MGLQQEAWAKTLNGRRLASLLDRLVDRPATIPPEIREAVLREAARRARRPVHPSLTRGHVDAIEILTALVERYKPEANADGLIEGVGTVDEVADAVVSLRFLADHVRLVHVHEALHPDPAPAP